MMLAASIFCRRRWPTHFGSCSHMRRLCRYNLRRTHDSTCQLCAGQKSLFGKRLALGSPSQGFRRCISLSHSRCGLRSRRGLRSRAGLPPWRRHSRRGFRRRGPLFLLLRLLNMPSSLLCGLHPGTGTFSGCTSEAWCAGGSCVSCCSCPHLPQKTIQHWTQHSGPGRLRPHLRSGSGCSTGAPTH
jgi:hypothetical protein